MLVLLSLAIPTLLGFVLHGFTIEGAIRGYIWAGSCGSSSFTT